MILGIDCSRFAAEQPTGVELYTDRIIEGLLQRAEDLAYDKIRCYVKTPKQLQGILDLVADELEGKLIEVVLIRNRRLWTVLGLSWELLRRRVDVFFEPSHTLPLWGAKRYIWTPHGMESDHFPKAYSWFQRVHRKCSIWLAKRKKTHYIAISRAVKQDMLRFHKIAEKDVTVVWNGFDPALGENPKTKDQNPKTIVSGDFILSVGRLEERKNQRRLVEAFDAIAQEFPELKLVLVGGDGYRADAVRERVKQSSHAHRIVLMGYQEEAVVDQLRRTARLFAYPSLAEGFGIPILEAFSVGCPVLTSKGGATEEIAGSAAAFCDPESVESIADGLKRLLTDDRLREQLVRDGSKRMDLFSWERCVEETIKVVRI